MRAPVVEVKSLDRAYPISGGKKIQALKNVNLTVTQGEVVAILGVNGAGKTTLAKILSTLLLPDSGSVYVLGHDAVTETKAIRSRMSVIFGGDRGLYSMLSGQENLAYFGMLAGVSRRDLKQRIPDMLEQVGLTDAKDRRVETYSKGMKQRLHIAIGLISKPRLLVLDEPTLGLDPNEAERLRGAIADLRNDAVTVLLTSHYLLDVERLADRVVMIGDGHVKHDLPLQEFASLVGYAAVVNVTVRGEIKSLSGLDPDFTTATSDMTTATFRVKEWSSELLLELGERFSGYEILDMSVRDSSLEEAFALVTGASS